ncbi:MAG: hydrogenase assembly protein HupF [Actinomycetota bacterium]|nr:hydrogenase assembly protein HupF [Actinomycetota bacterium]
MTTTAVPAATGLPPGLGEDLAAASRVLARRLAAGGTLWCAAPASPHHAQHVAVEFVHPVVVGKPALAAVALPPHEATTVARANARPGDVLVVIGPAASAPVLDLVRRAPAWGVASLWIGAGERPAAGAADHVLWLTDEAAEHDGGFILVYHLLWELAHVWLEHPGLLRPDDPCEGPVCVTCSDEGRLAEVVDVRGASAVVRTDQGIEDADLSLVGAVAEHDLLVVHAGMAITRLDAAAPDAAP